MPLGSAFWASVGDGCRWLHNFTSAIINVYPTMKNAGLVMTIQDIKMYQAPFVTGGGGGTQNVNSGFDTGYFLLCDSALTYLTATRYVSMMYASIGIGGSTNPQPQWKQIYGSSFVPGSVITQGDLYPSSESVAIERGVYQTGFIDNLGGTPYVYGGVISMEGIAWFNWPTASTRDYYVWHYNPWAWFGTVPQVIADIVMKCGLGSSYINQTTFDGAHDAYDLITGDIPYSSASGGGWPGSNAKNEIAVCRKIGGSCIDLILECARHGRDMFFTDERGRLSVSSFTRPSEVVAGLDLDDGVIGDVSYLINCKYVMTNLLVSWGAGVRVSGDFLSNPMSSTFSASEEQNLESYEGRKLSGSWIDFSIPYGGFNRFGAIDIVGRTVFVSMQTQPEKTSRTHYPFFLDSFKKSTAYNYSLGFLHYFSASDGKVRKFITLTQDFRALDWGVGAKLTGVKVTSDGQTVDDCRCIERTYDFNRLTVTSVLMEVPPNT